MFRITKTDLGSLGVNYTLQNYNKHIEAWMPIHTIKKSAMPVVYTMTNKEIRNMFQDAVTEFVNGSVVYEQELD